jgi:N-acetylglucosamine kinase-like BadF-type ATPase
MTAPTVLALDGGNSKTDVVLLRATGEILAQVRSGPFHPHLVGAVRAVAAIAPDVAAVLTRAGVVQADLVAAYLANADLPVETAAIAAEIDRLGWGASTVVDNDTYAVLRAGTERGFGVAVVCGAGINCVGVAPDGAQLRFPALGRITGDWGGGLGLAEEVLWWAVRAEDGRGPATALAADTAGHFGLASATAVAEQFHLGTLPDVRLHELVTLLFTAASAGDAVAHSIVGRQAEEVVLLVETTARRLDLSGADIDVVLGGGILAARDAVLIEPVLQRLTAALPTARVHFLTERPVLGAALLGLEQLWATSGDVEAAALRRAQDRVRAELSREPVTADTGERR